MNYCYWTFPRFSVIILSFLALFMVIKCFLWIFIFGLFNLCLCNYLWQKTNVNCWFFGAIFILWHMFFLNLLWRFFDLIDFNCKIVSNVVYIICVEIKKRKMKIIRYYFFSIYIFCDAYNKGIRFTIPRKTWKT